MEGFFKVKQSGGSYVVAVFYNPYTGETRSECVRDYDYGDCSRDNDELYNMPIDEEVRSLWLHSQGQILAGDTVEVFKGRKVPRGNPLCCWPTQHSILKNLWHPAGTASRC